MKIGNPLDKAVAGSSSTKTEAASTTSTKAAGKTTALDVSESAKVTLSNAASDLMSGVDPTFDAQKVSKVKQAIDDGSYQIDPEAIADKLIANSRELLARR